VRVSAFGTPKHAESIFLIMVILHIKALQSKSYPQDKLEQFIGGWYPLGMPKLTAEGKIALISDRSFGDVIWYLNYVQIEKDVLVIGSKEDFSDFVGRDAVLEIVCREADESNRFKLSLSKVTPSY
jgi:hypothetical protein